MSRFLIGIDLGGTKVHAALADSSGTIVDELVEPTTAGGGAALVSQLVALVGKLASAHGISAEDIAATGVGGAGVPNDTAGFDLAPNLASSGIGFVHRLEAALGHPVLLENDVNVAAIGELHGGVGIESDNFVYVAVGTGIGMGIIANGRLIRGAAGAAGEIGFLPIGADPFDPINHRRGPLEEVVAGHMVADRYNASTGHVVTTREVFQLAGSGDPSAIDAIQDEAKFLALALVAVNAVLNPEIIILGGGIGSRPELVQALRPWLDRLGASSLDIRLSQLGHRAAVAGAVRLALDHVILSEPQASRHAESTPAILPS